MKCFCEIYRNIFLYASHAFLEHCMGKCHYCTSCADVYIFYFIYFNNYMLCLFNGRNVEVSNIACCEVLTSVLRKVQFL
jgi:hypothetical protein